MFWAGPEDVLLDEVIPFMSSMFLQIYQSPLHLHTGSVTIAPLGMKGEMAAEPKLLNKHTYKQTIMLQTYFYLNY